MEINLRRYHAVVCGSTKGIGRTTALALARAGARVSLVARDETALKDILAEVQDLNGEAHTYRVADFSEPEQVNKAIHDLVAHDPDNVHILVNNTGGPPAGPLTEALPDELESAFRMHLIAYQHLAQAVLPGMKAAGFGRIINIISTSVKQPIPGLGVSNTIRGAVANWAKTLSHEVAPWGITVNNILPGYTETQRLHELIEKKAKDQTESYQTVAERMQRSVPAGRFAQPEELADAAVFLASHQAGYINGVNLPVDGGRTSSL